MKVYMFVLVTCLFCVTSARAESDFFAEAMRKINMARVEFEREIADRKDTIEKTNLLLEQNRERVVQLENYLMSDAAVQNAEKVLLAAKELRKIRMKNEQLWEKKIVAHRSVAVYEQQMRDIEKLSSSLQ